MKAIGIDLHKNMFVACYIEGEKSQARTYKMEEIEKFIGTLEPDDKIALESTGNSRYFAEKVKDKVSKVAVVNPFQFKVVKDSVKKTDKNDAELLAFFLQKDLLPEIRLGEASASQLKSMAKTRGELVKSRTALMNKIHSILNYHGVQSKKGEFATNVGLERLSNLNLDEAAKLELEVIVDEIKHINQNIKKLENYIDQMSQNMKGMDNITSIKGIGKLGGSILLSVIGDVNNFEEQKKLSAYFGIVPRVRQSNNVIHQGRITKHGSKLGRTTLIQCTLSAKKYSPYLQDFYNRVLKRRGKGKAIVATANKMLGIIYMTLKENLIFEDFPNFVLKQV